MFPHPETLRLLSTETALNWDPFFNYTQLAPRPISSAVYTVVHIQVYSVHIYIVSDPYCLLHYAPLFFCLVCWLLDCLKNNTSSYWKLHKHGIIICKSMSMACAFNLYSWAYLCVHVHVCMCEYSAHKYRFEEICIAFNGGKDCTVMMDLLHATLQR